MKRNKPMDWKWLYEMVQKIDNRGDEQAKVLERLTTTVEEHVRRTNILEEKMERIEEHVTMVRGVGKFLASIPILAAIYKLFV